jgi:hypothetical protein
MRVVSILVTRGDGAMGLKSPLKAETGGQRHAAGSDAHVAATHSANSGDIDRSVGDIIYDSSDGG